MRFIAFALAGILGPTVSHVAIANARPFTVSDSIEMVRIVDDESAWKVSGDAPTTAVELSPDGSLFTVVTRTGNLRTGKNEYRLLLFETDAVLKFVRSDTGAQMPRPDVLATFELSQPRAYEGGIAGVRWMPDSRTLLFIGRREDRIGQVYRLEVGTRLLRQLTEHPENVVHFDFSSASDALLFSADVTPDWERRNKHGYAVKSDPINYLVTRDPNDAFKKLAYFATDLVDGRVVEIRSPAGFAEYPRLTAVSPNGRWAVVLMKVADVPADWVRYEFLQRTLDVATRPTGNADTASSGLLDDLLDADWYGGGMEELWRLQFGLIDLRAGTLRPLLDAPVSARPAVAQALWSADGSRVVVGATYLPLREASGPELENRLRAPVVAEVEVATGKITQVAAATPRVTPNGRSILLSAIERLSDDSILIRERISGSSLAPPPKVFRRRAGRWAEVADAATARAQRITVVIAQSEDTAPELAAMDGNGHRRVFTDFNPAFRDRMLGTTRTITWTDRLGRSFTGALLLPPRYEQGSRYPLVIQNYWFTENQFLVDGAPAVVTSSFAARPLANRGILVLQMDAHVRLPENAAGDWHTRGENPRALVALESAISALDAKGLIDPARVGLIGWSRSGMHAMHAITFGCRPFAAVSIADSHGTTPWLYYLTYGREGMLEWESENLIGAPFWAEGIGLWQERSTAFHLHRVRTPLRYEHYGTYPPSYWDAYVMLKRQSRPVEMIHLPLATHNLESPFARYTSQQGNVDWFDFWLNGREDPDPAKAEQYVRWRKLRRQHDAHLDSLRESDRTKQLAGRSAHASACDRAS